MCGRYTLKTPPDQWGQLLLPILDSRDPAGDSPEWLPDWKPRYNIAPTQNILTVCNDDSGRWYGDYLRWGLIPSWATELSIGNRMINARSETIDEKRSFSPAFKKRRCLVVADGYYEWQKQPDGSKQPCWISPADGGVMCFAGVWESNSKVSEHSVRSCAIITTAANEQLSVVHDRMPVVLQDIAAETWLRPDCPVDQAKALLNPAAEVALRVTHVSNFVNNPRNESSKCIEPSD